MILGFSTKINGKPSYFVEKIHSGLVQNRKMEGFDIGYDHNFDIDKLAECQPKIHTLRIDNQDRWKKGTIIDFYINVRQKNMFRFAPKLPVVDTQKVYLSYLYNDIIEISIDSKQLHNPDEIKQFIINDGFESYTDFFNFFYPQIIYTHNNSLKLKLIHWTDLRY